MRFRPTHIKCADCGVPKEEDYFTLFQLTQKAPVCSDCCDAYEAGQQAFMDDAVSRNEYDRAGKAFQEGYREGFNEWFLSEYGEQMTDDREQFQFEAHLDRLKTKPIVTVAQLALGTSIAILVGSLFCFVMLVDEREMGVRRSPDASRQGRLHTRVESTGRQ